MNLHNLTDSGRHQVFAPEPAYAPEWVNGDFREGFAGWTAKEEDVRLLAHADGSRHLAKTIRHQEWRPSAVSGIVADGVVADGVVAPNIFVWMRNGTLHLWNFRIHVEASATEPFPLGIE